MFFIVDGTLLPRIPHQAGHHRLTIRIVKIGLKYPFKYIDPFITVSVKGLCIISLFNMHLCF